MVKKVGTTTLPLTPSLREGGFRSLPLWGRVRVGVLFFGALLLWHLTAVPAVAQTPISIANNQAVVDFPQTITFQLELAEGSAITQATLTYRVNRSGCIEANTTVNVPLDPENPHKIEWPWVMIRSGNPPPGAVVWWEWTLTDADGRQTTIPRQEITLADNRFNWRMVEADRIRIYWYQGQQVGPILLDAAVEGLAFLEEEMGIELQDDVQFYIYGNARDMREAVLYIQDWAGGVAFTQYNVILMGVAPASAAGWGSRTARHELAHLVLGQFGRSCVGGSRPTWLEEGLAVYAEGELDEAIRRDLDLAVRRNSFEPVRSLNGPFPAHGREAGIAYGQSYSLVAFLLETYGREQIQRLVLLLAEGEEYDAALEQIYGFNVDGLEREWRIWLELPARDFPPTPTPIVGAAVPTVAPLAVARAMPTPPAAAATPLPFTPTNERQPAPICGGLLPLLILLSVLSIAPTATTRLRSSRDFQSRLH
jgi:hypothetical protein